MGKPAFPICHCSCFENIYTWVYNDIIKKSTNQPLALAAAAAAREAITVSCGLRWDCSG
jgi:hypothetical protein